MQKLYIANKNYSSWSLRPWVLMQELKIPFVENKQAFSTGTNWDDFRNFSPNGLVPCLQDGENTIWDSLAIVEYLAETDSKVWPESKQARAWARCASAEMHSGFTNLRNQCPMNCGLRIELRQISDGLQKDITRISELWKHGLEQFNGPYLAGNSFTAVDAFYAPVVFRIQTYNLKMGKKSLEYINRILSLKSMQSWYKEALQETWREKGHEQEAKESGIIIKDLRTGL